MEIDPAAVIRCRSVHVSVGGVDYRIAARGAGDWMMAILDQGWADIVPGMLDAGPVLDRLYDDLTDGTVSTSDCEKAAQEALSAIAGVPFWVAVKLIHAASRDPAAIGELRLSGVDLGTAPLGAVVAGLYRIYTRDREQKDITKFDAELMRMPPGMMAERYDEQAASDAFEQAYRQRGGR